MAELKTDDELLALLKAAKHDVEAMSFDEYQDMLREQAKSWARAEMNWPAPRYKFVNGVKVYESYEDYCNG